MLEQDDVKRDYIVELEVLSTHTLYIEDCNTPEEAEAIAEEIFMADDDDRLSLTSKEITSVDSYPAERKEEKIN